MDLGISIEAASQDQYDVLPDGWYFSRITSAEVKDTKAGTGSYISIRYDITGPSHEGRVVWGNLNLSNPNPRAEQIGREQLAQLTAAIGLKSISDSDELIGGECQIKLKVKEDDYGIKNEVKGFKAVSGSNPPSVATPPSAAPAAPAQDSKPPWAK